MRGGVLWEASTVPGPSSLIGGNLQAGFYGEVPAEDFIIGDELARRIGLTAGESQFSNEPWLKFSYMGNVEFVAKKPFRHSISWDDINKVGSVFGNKTITIGKNKYKIRLLKGKAEGKQEDYTSNSGQINQDSEWNRLMLPIHEKAPSNWSYAENVKSPTSNWNIGYSNSDLITGNATGNGSYNWCQEYGSSAGGRLYRGRYDISYSGFYMATAKQPYFGWRPVLELVD